MVIINKLFDHISYFRVINLRTNIKSTVVTVVAKPTLVVILLLYISRVYAQQPAYFVMGEQQFRGIQIYDVIQDNELNYWFATNDGIYYYNYYSYRKIECNEAKSNAIFNFVIDNEGTIYCHNLNHQIFRIKNKKCTLFYELQENERASYESLAVSDDGHLLIGAKNIVVLNKQGKIVMHKKMTGSFGHPYKPTPNEILYYNNSADILLSYSNGQFTEHKLSFTAGKAPPRSNLSFFKLRGTYYAMDGMSKERYLFNTKTYQLTALPKDEALNSLGFLRFYETSKGLWVANSVTGTVFFPNEITPNVPKSYYKDYFISFVYEDKEGNFLISTFDKGILVIPDINIPDVINTIEDDPITSMFSGISGGLFLGSSKGKLFKYKNNELQEIDANGKRSIQGIYGNALSDMLLYDNGKINLYDTKKNRIVQSISGSLKDAAIISENEVYIGTNYGLQKIRRAGKQAFTVESIPNMQNRVYSLAYSPKSKSIYVSTSNGLYVCDTSGSNAKITHHNNDIFPNSLYHSEGKIYASTKKDGILVISGQKVEKIIRPRVDEKQEELKKIVIYKNSIVGNSSDGLFQFDMEGRLLKSIHTTFRFSNKNVIDFAFDGEDLWVSHSGGVQKTNINYKNDTTFSPSVRIERIQVNDSVLKNRGHNQFNSKQKKIVFTFSSPTLRNRENTRYQYRLTGYETTWNTNNYESNIVTYNALAPGNYMLEVRTRYGTTYSPVVTYSFSIARPLYLRWYSVTIMVLFFLAVVYIIYRWQLRIQQTKSQQINELNASKLTAIQSQMNPHFIFNSLNSIQDLILKGDVENSYSYITTFSNLVRLTLNYSDKEFIDFEQEIKLLELYLSLEKLRFKKDFTYSIETNEIADIQIPPMLIQPFIENSLVHGLLHKEGKKELRISFELKDELICTIEDNGIGRKKARAINLRQHSDHESFSGKAIRNRFEILSDVLGGQFHYSNDDLDATKEDTGTRVTLTIPVKRKF